jgi:O-antigen ligase
MRRIAWVLLLLFAFTIPWEYSLDLGEPLGNIARLVGLLLLLVAIPAVLQSRRMRVPGAMQALVLAFYLWFCCTYFWTIEPLVTLARLRGYFQEMMVVWLVWEFAESAGDLRALLRAYVAGAWVLAILTVANFATTEAVAGQIRFVAEGQDPNDVARFLDLALPMAALLVNSERKWRWRTLAAGYLPVGFVAVLLTASRGGFIAALAALAGSGLLLAHGHPRRVLAATLALPPIGVLLWFIVPHGTFERLATISEQLQGGDLNMRWKIWAAGWHAFVRAPFFGTGAGSFVSAAGLGPIDTAHNTALSIAVSGGLCGLFLASAIVAAALWSISQTRGPIRWAMATTLLVWLITSLVDTVEESRTTWLLLALIALAGRLGVEEPEALAACFAACGPDTCGDLGIAQRKPGPSLLK